MTARDRPGKRTRGLSPAYRWLLGLTGLAGLAAISEGLGRAGIVHRDFLPPASTVLLRAAGLARDPVFMDNLASTAAAWAAGLAIAVVAGVPLGLLLGCLPRLDTAVRAVLEFLRPIPSVALIPLVGLILGTGLATEVTLIAYAATWPALFNTIYGLRGVNPIARDTLRAFGFGRLSVVWRVSLPYAAPFIATGVRLAAAVALILAIGTEILSGFGEGLGTFIAQAQQSIDGTADVLAGTVWAGALGLVINSVLVHGERRMFRWHAAMTSGGGAAR
jgi:NitT/TauT family transport system permease protein